MPDEKPFGWRPFSDEYRADLLTRMTPEQVDEWEASNTYEPNEMAVLAFHLARSLMRTAAKRFGPEFVDEVRSDLAALVAKLEKSQEVEDRVEAKIIAPFLEGQIWSAAARDAVQPKQ